jgi:hypothetical protein
MLQADHILSQSVISGALHHGYWLTIGTMIEQPVESEFFWYHELQVTGIQFQ